MNTDKAKRLLTKAQALFDNLSDQGTMSALERDLLLSYLRDLYEEISSPQTIISTVREIIEPPRVTIEKPAVETPVPPKTTFQSPPTWQEPPKPIIPEPVHTRVEQVVTPGQREYVEPVSEIKPKTPIAQQTFIPPAVVQSSSVGNPEGTLTALFELKQAGELAEKLKLQPIDRIEHGMGINERILTINELFSGDSDLFKRTIDDLNNLHDFSDAQGYLIEGVATQFNWADEKKRNKAEFFIQLIRRRYVRNN